MVIHNLLRSDALRAISATAAGGEQQAEATAERERVALAEELQAAAEQCRRRFGGRAELATEAEACVLQLCAALERALEHGLARGPGPAARGFWPSVREQLARHERERFAGLRSVRTDRGRGRAWLRAALNERALEAPLRALLAGGPAALRAHYRRGAFLLDQCRSSMLPSLAAGLTAVLFAMRVDSEELDAGPGRACPARTSQTLAEPLINPEPPDACPSRVKLRKKVHSHVICFDDEAVDADAVASSAARVDRSVDPSAAPETLSCGPTCSGALRADASQLEISPEAEDVVVDVKASLWQHEAIFEEKLLTPLTDGQTIGGLMPVSPIVLGNMLTNLPSYLDVNGATEPAVEATEPFINTCSDADILNVEALKLRLSALSEVIEQTRGEADSSKIQLARFQNQHQNYIEKCELQIQTLNRENELLRQQLRKYVTAVQLLKENSAASVELKEDSSSGYHKESEQYQIKLIQVAEMHAELMELNARLTMQLNNKDRLVKLLQTELECLRGPINEDVSTTAPFFIHIWIPSAFLTGQTSDIHHVYQIYIRIRDTEWNIYRRYAQFHALYRELKKQDSVITTFDFPPKKTIGNKDAKFVEDRRQKLQQWLRRIVNRLSHCSGAFSSNPTKQTLITLLPFFGDLPHNLESKRNDSSANIYSSTSPHYMGL
ncbi:sorting nexin-29 isoform X2 [Phymastichus coffea]|uniref:sorting nexin-29 isoform X2 n=1 Tax=Phymastichus coffea TaxID=108790 RepID=UPI00273B524D|nr:sorting nexin-29 isoform X2 [Phymastichus coffea]XP_058795777.1 sorting nexin-29 isoform X2 [Phymastichus coffea]XP_058795778.1 sorting nexin-29 isoform X2 [Phymastichus coffea]